MEGQLQVGNLHAALAIAALRLSSLAPVALRVNDRGRTQTGRIANVSPAAAHQLGTVRSGVIAAQLEVVGDATARKSSLP